jgi:hypothetical protein
MPFQYQPYEGAAPFVRSIGELLANQGQIRAQQAQQVAQAQARAAELSGQAYVGAAQQIGSTIGQIPQQMQAQKTRDVQMQDVKAQIDERNAVAAQRKAATDGLAAVDHIMKSAMVPDPQTGVVSFDRKVFEQGLAQSGQGHLYPQYAEMLDKLDSAASKRNADARSMIAQVIYGIHEHGDTPDALLSGAAYLKANQLVTDEHLSPILGAIGANPTPDNIKATLDKLTDGMPEYRQLVEAEGKRKADQAKTAAETAKATAEGKKIEAEVAGTLPPTPAQKQTAEYQAATLKQTAEHQAATLKIAQDAERRLAGEAAEKAKHDRASELAANPLAALTGGAAGGAQPAAAQGPTGDEFLKTLPPNIASEVKAYAEGRRPFPAGFALKSPYFQTLIQMVGQYDPTFEAANYNARAKARTDLTSPGGTGGKTINALNTALQHAGRLSDLIETLNNYEMPAANAIANPIATAMGKTSVTNFKAVAPQLMKEIERAWRGTGGSAAEIKDLIDSIGSNKGRQQQREALGQFVDLVKGKLDSTQQQRDNIMGPAGASIPVLFDQNVPIMQKIADRASGAAKPKVLKLVNGKLVPE